MRKISVIALLCLVLTACAPAEPVETTLPTETAAPATVPTTAPAEEKLHIPGVSTEEVILWFNEVCLDAEIIHSGDASLLQKWAEPIRYQIIGDPTPEDLSVLEGFAQWLNTMEGFPGISETTEWGNLRIHFVTEAEMLNVMGPDFSGMDGAVTFWYAENEIYDATICIRTDLPQSLRNSVILEELYNGLGPIQDTALRPDSIIYAEYAEPQRLTEVDELVLRLLYHPDMCPGMDVAQCEAIIREIYE
jgi:hypothetical protein